MGTRNIDGIWEASRYDEIAGEFNGEILDWQNRQAIEDGEIILESDMSPEPDSWGHGEPSDRDIAWFTEHTYCDPMERDY